MMVGEKEGKQEGFLDGGNYASITNDGVFVRGVPQWAWENGCVGSIGQPGFRAGTELFQQLKNVPNLCLLIDIATSSPSQKNF